MLIILIMQIAQSMQISIRHFLTPQTMHITFPLKNLAVKNISGLTHCRYSSGKWTMCSGILPPQGSAFSPFLFAIIIDSLMKNTRKEAPWQMKLVDDVVVTMWIIHVK